jgi:hypothetical protein
MSKSIGKIISFLISRLSILLQSVTMFLLRSVDQLLGTLPNLIRANLILSRKISQKSSQEVSSCDRRLELPTEHLRSQYEVDLKRLERIEEKARSTVIGVAISVSLATPSILLLTRPDALAGESFCAKLFLAILLALAVLFLLVSGFLALSGYKVGSVYRPRIEDHESLTSEQEIRKGLLFYIELNRLLVIRKANFLSGSMDCLRNGITLVLVFLVVALWFAIS